MRKEYKMGYGAWRREDFVDYSKRMNRTVGKDGSLTGSYSNQELFLARHLDPALNPRGVIRECCDSEEHPQTLPVILALDVTGSMGQAAVEVAKKLNVIMTKLYDQMSDVQFMVMGIGDFAYDQHPLQVTQFEADIRIAEQLDKLYFEFGGGGNSYESYTASWYFALHHTRLDAWKRDQKGILITMGDERLNPYIPIKGSRCRFADVTGDALQGDVQTKELFRDVREKYELYHLDVNHRGGYDAEGIRKSWRAFLDREHFRVVTIDEITDAIVRIVTGARDAEQKKEAGFLKKMTAGIAW